jgi:hypothetical protein
MKRTALALTLILALLISALAATLIVHVGTANPFIPSGSWSNEPIPPSISVQSPSEKQNYYNGSDVWLNFTVTKPKTSWYSSKLFPDRSLATTSGSITQVRFSLDGKQENNANKVSEYRGVLYFSFNLGRLSDGQHAIIITAEGSAYYGTITHDLFAGSGYSLEGSANTKLVKDSVQINFVVGGVPPSVQILSPENKTYATSEASLNLIVDLFAFSKIEFSLDGQENVTITGNTTLTGLSNGAHDLTVYATDYAGRSFSETNYFSIAQEPQQTESFPMLPVIAVSVTSVVVVAVGVLVYFRKRNHARINKRSEIEQSSTS